MTCKEALLALIAGRKVTRSHWSNIMVLYYCDGAIYHQGGVEYSFKDRPDYGWVIVEEDV